QVTVTIDEARQNGLALDVNDLRTSGNSDFAASADGLKPACVNHDHRILDRRPSCAVDQSSTLHDENLFGHVFYSFLVPISRRLRDQVRGIGLQPLDLSARSRQESALRLYA